MISTRENKGLTADMARTWPDIMSGRMSATKSCKFFLYSTLRQRHLRTWDRECGADIWASHVRDLRRSKCLRDSSLRNRIADIWMSTTTPLPLRGSTRASETPRDTPRRRRAWATARCNSRRWPRVAPGANGGRTLRPCLWSTRAKVNEACGCHNGIGTPARRLPKWHGNASAVEEQFVDHAPN